MPQRRKAPERRQGRETRDIGLVARLPGAPVPDPPGLPGRKQLLKATVDAWDAFWGSELAPLAESIDAATALSRLFRMYDSRERFERIVLEAPMTTGSTGQLVVNPAAAQVASLDGRILALEDRFGITPMARLKLGITFGAAQKSLEELNDGFDADDDLEEDPRVIDVAG